MLKIGITVGVSSGNTILAEVFEVRGIPVSYAVEAAIVVRHKVERYKQLLIYHHG